MNYVIRAFHKNDIKSVSPNIYITLIMLMKVVRIFPVISCCNKSCFYPLIIKNLCITELFGLQITSGGQSTQIKYLSKSTDTYSKILLR